MRLVVNQYFFSFIFGFELEIWVSCRYTSGEFPLPSETELADFYRMASSTLSDAGFKHYEIMLVDWGFQGQEN